MTDQDQGAGFNPMGMMKKMMGQMQEGSMNPMQMCRMMSESVARTAEVATWATPELRALFDDWSSQLQEELLAKVAESEEAAELEQLAEELGIGSDSLAFLLVGLARNGKIKLSVSAAVPRGE